MLALAEADGDEAMVADLAREIETLERNIDAIETKSLLSGEHDRLGAIVSIHPGAGGTESQDWAEMLLRMYQRWAERHGYKVTLLDHQAGEEAGIKDGVLEIDGEYAYGYLKAENGVHRLVRISPYDANQRRHTSFSSVSVTPAIDDTIKVEINPVDLRVDTFRASGAGGQHVNKTESAVRITHLPTGIVAECQDGRSQHQNKDRAMAVLAARIKDRETREAQAKEAATRKSLIGSGDRSERIRTYNFPQGRITDHRINLTLYKIAAIMDGDLDELTNALAAEHQAELLAALGEQ
jgi:peptide chain release factor 1